MLDSRLLHAREALELLERNFGDLVFRTRVRKTVRFAEAPVCGQSVIAYDPHGQPPRSYRELAEEVLSDAEEAG